MVRQDRQKVAHRVRIMKYDVAFFMTPLMQHGIEMAKEAEKLIVHSELPLDAKSDMLTIFLYQ
ncbi:MAG: hypothetical protein GXP42_08215 [Chloroflexi bacterium]|nr:hypothetical protein [Chloroflexota bacterium]